MTTISFNGTLSWGQRGTPWPQLMPAAPQAHADASPGQVAPDIYGTGISGMWEAVHVGLCDCFLS